MKICCKLFILLSLCVIFQNNIVAQSDLEKIAETAIKANQLSKAREIYAQLYEQNKSKIAYLNWVGRLSAWLGEYKKAIEIYEKVLQIEPNNSEAKVGKSYVLMWQKKYKDAKNVLDSGEKNEAWYVAKINYYRYQNQKNKALKLIIEAKESFPKNIEIKNLEQAVKNMKTYVLDVGCSQTAAPFSLLESTCFTSLKTKKGKNEINFQLEQGKKFGRNYQQIGFNIKHQLTPKLAIFSGISVSPKAILNQKFGINSGFQYELNKKISFGSDLKFVEFKTKKVFAFNPNLQYKLNKKNQFSATIYQGKDSISSKSFAYSISYNRQIFSRLQISSNYAKIKENTVSNKFSIDSFSFRSNYKLSKNYFLNGQFGLTKDSSGKKRTVYGVNMQINF